MTPSLGRVAESWGRIGVTGFGGPPTHVSLLRRLVVEDERWMTAEEFQDANAACGLLPGPASTQLAIFCALRVRGRLGALVGGLAFILPAVLSILALSLLFLARSPPLWVRGAGAGAGAAVPVVAVSAAWSLVRPSLARAGSRATERSRWLAYVIAGLLGAVLLGPYLVLVLLGCGTLELLLQRRLRILAVLVPMAPMPAGGLGALAWTALKVGALSFGGGFVIVPLMQGDTVHAYHWMTNARFLDAVALGQVTPGPVVATVAAVGYAAHGVIGWGLAALIAFTPSFLLVLVLGPRFQAMRTRPAPRAFLDGAGPAAIGAIGGAAITLALACGAAWQYGVLIAAALAMFLLRRGVVGTLVCAGIAGAILALAGVPPPG